VKGRSAEVEVVPAGYVRIPERRSSQIRITAPTMDTSVRAASRRPLGPPCRQQVAEARAHDPDEDIAEDADLGVESS
jgi:hypothetical protein